MKKTIKKNRKQSKKPQTKIPTFEKPASQITSPFQALFLEAKNLFKNGIYNALLLEKVKELHQLLEENSSILREDDEVCYWKSKTFMSEVYDCFGLIDESKIVTQEGKEIYETLPTIIDKNASIDERTLLREKIRFCLSWAVAYFYRTRSHKEAEIRVSRIHDLVSKGLRSQLFPCNGTMGQISYYRGKIYRQLGRFDDANTDFANAINYYDKRGVQKKNELAKKPALAIIENRFSIHRAAICLGLGLGWVNHTRADLRTSLNNNIIPAHLMLLTTEDELNRAALDNIRGAIIRSLGKTNKDILESIKFIENANEVFKRYNHRRYMAWSAYDLALSYFYANDFDLAKKHLGMALTIANELKDSKWITKAHTLHSRIKYKLMDYKSAEIKASKALMLADRSKQVLCEIDALIWRGAIRIEMNKCSEARLDLERASKLNRQRQDVRRNVETANPRIEALCNIFLACSYAFEHERLKAESLFKKWEHIADEVEDQRVHDIAELVSEDIENLKSDFVIEKIDPDSPRFQREKMTPENIFLQDYLNYTNNRHRLQKFLVEQSKSISEDKQDIAKLLGISRQTLFQWEKEWEKEENLDEN